MNSHHDYKTCIEELYEVEGKGMRSKHSLSVGSQLTSLIQTYGALCQRRVSAPLHGRREERCHHTLACSSSVIARGGHGRTAFPATPQMNAIDVLHRNENDWAGR